MSSGSGNYHGDYNPACGSVITVTTHQIQGRCSCARGYGSNGGPNYERISAESLVNIDRSLSQICSLLENISGAITANSNAYTEKTILQQIIVDNTQQKDNKAIC